MSFSRTSGADSRNDEVADAGDDGVVLRRAFLRRLPQTLGVSPSRRDNVDPRHHREIQVPELSRVFGIIIAMYYNDHSPPHFHAKYGGEQASIRIDNGVILESALRARSVSSTNGASFISLNCSMTGTVLRPASR